MSRPAHIAALDDALDEHLARLVRAERSHAEVLERHAGCLREIEEAQGARMKAFYAARDCERAIKRLDFVVLNERGGVVPKDASRLDGHSGNFNEAPTAASTEAREEQR